jgi:G:T/U-mismatch repair DNA glycosylase
MAKYKDHPWKERHYTIEPHPYGEFIPTDTEFLMIGSFPSKGEKYFDFFYGSKVNQLWNILSVVFGHNFKKPTGKAAEKERGNFLETRGIGMTDMLEKCYRYQNKSGDENLYPIIFRDIFEILERRPKIRRLIFTGRYYIIGPLGLFITFLQQHGQELDDLTNDGSGLLSGTWHYKPGRSINIMVPISPSPRAAEYSELSFDDLVKMYKKCFGR